jgi:MFS family permease
MTRIIDGPKSWQRLVIALLIAIVANIGIWANVLVMPAIEAEFHSGRAETALAYTLTMIGFGLGNVAMGRVMDRLGIALALVAGSIIVGLSFTFAASAGSLLLVAIAHLFLGIGTAVGFGPLIADISHWFERRRGIAVAIIASGNYLSGAIWPPLLTDMLIESGWRDVYFFLGVMVVVMTLPLSLALRGRPDAETRNNSSNISSDGPTQFTIPGRDLQLLLGIAGICCCVAMSMPQIHIVAYCVGLGYGPAIGAELLSVMLACGVISRLMFGFLADQIGGIRTLMISSGLQMVSLFFFLPFNGLVSLYVVSAVFGLSQGGIVPSYAIVVREFLPAREAGERVGLVLMMTVFGMGLGGWMSGLIFDFTGSYKMAFLNGAAWNMINLSIMGWLLIRLKMRPTSC